MTAQDARRGLFFAAAKAKEVQIDIYEQIGMSMFEEGITAKQFARDLKAAGDVDTIHLRINSPGGDVFDGLAIYNMLKDHPAKVNVTVMGLAASAASLIAMAGDTIRMQEASEMMIHRAWALAIGNANDMEKMATSLRSIDSSLGGVYAARSGSKQDAIMKLMDEETWFSADAAMKAGLADEVIPLKERVNAKFAFSKTFAKTPEEFLPVTQTVDASAEVEYLRDRLAMLRAS